MKNWLSICKKGLIMIVGNRSQQRKFLIPKLLLVCLLLSKPSIGQSDSDSTKSRQFQPSSSKKYKITKNTPEPIPIHYARASKGITTQKNHDFTVSMNSKSLHHQRLLLGKTLHAQKHKKTNQISQKMRFRKHFANVLGGYPEGNYTTICQSCSIFKRPNKDSAVVGTLTLGDPVHVISILKNGWAKIGHKHFVKFKDIKNIGSKTKGLEKYKKYRSYP